MSHNDQEEAEHSDEKRHALTAVMSGLSDQIWLQLGLCQSFHQQMVLTMLHGIERSMTREQLINEVKTDLIEPISSLFSHTAIEHVEQLINSGWLAQTSDLIIFHSERLKHLLESMSYHETEGWSLQAETHTRSKVTPSRVEGVEHMIAHSASRRQTATLPFVDPMEHISKANESPFTIRRLDRILTSLDGIPLLTNRLAELLKVPLSEVEEVFTATDRLGLTLRTGDYIKLEFAGTKIARLPREERLKTLAIMASRLRREAKIQKRADIQSNAE